MRYLKPSKQLYKVEKYVLFFLYMLSLVYLSSSVLLILLRGYLWVES
jgi:hypothetical protein